ncbi:MAG: I78 family peptidase inhibitor [Alterinioella nitratireducens]|uniref:I78 family peptidase inhibitor n=1 Tax=Alterinioella nitratireducens TaxID=2735915 RepID=UPI004058B5E4
MDRHPPAPRNDGCGAGSMQSYVGQPLSYAYATDAAMNARILRPGMITNMMYDAQRLNFHVDSGDTITRIACG